MRINIEIDLGDAGPPMQYGTIIDRAELRDLAPIIYDGFVDPAQLCRERQASERRQRLIDMVSTTIARHITEAIFKYAKERGR